MSPDYAGIAAEFTHNAMHLFGGLLLDLFERSPIRERCKAIPLQCHKSVTETSGNGVEPHYRLTLLGGADSCLATCLALLENLPLLTYHVSYLLARGLDSGGAI